MSAILIEEITVDHEGQLFVRPRLPPGEDFAHIYRTASGINWMEGTRTIGAREPHRWEHVELFKQIIAAVKSEYGQTLVLAKETRWLNVSSELRQELQACA